MKRKKIILIGKTGSGKTTLIQKLEARELVYRKTQAIEFSLHFIDTPGEYLENRKFYSALIVTSYDADLVGLVEDCTSDEVWLPPAFASTFAKETIGIVTKTDLARDPGQVQAARERLRQAGAVRIFELSAVLGDGIEALSRHLGL
ncbi:MAG: EutP/PduV family microcompartment system protein [Oscillospiraceae bacterium]